MTRDESAIERVCGNCHRSHPAEPYGSNFAICLQDTEFEPYIDEIIERQDFSRCQDLARRKRFPWDREACAEFDPVDDVDDAVGNGELGVGVMELARDGKLDGEALEKAILDDVLKRIDWTSRPVDDLLRDLEGARTLVARLGAVRRFGYLIGQGNRAAFDGLCRYLAGMPPPASVPEKDLRIGILRQLELAREPDVVSELARLLVDDLFRTPSNRTTRGWYTAVLNYFARSCPAETAAEALERVIASPRFSSRIKHRVREILECRTGGGTIS